MTTSIALLSPIYVTLFWGIIFLFQKKSANTPRWILGIFMLVATLLYVSHAIFFSRMYHLYSFFEGIYIYAGLTLYPLFYTYILKLTNLKLQLPKHFIHFIPGMLFGLVALIITFFLSPEQRIYYVRQILIETNLKDANLNTLPGIKGWTFLVSRIIFIAQTIIYLALIIRLANKHNQIINNYFSNTEGKKMNWVSNLSITAFVVSIVAIIFALLGRSYFIHHNISLLLPSAFFSIIFFLIGFKGYQQHPIIENLYDNEKTKEDITLSAEEDLKKRLLILFETKKIYQLNDLRINTVCESLHTNRTYISKLINDEFGMNFNEFTNKYRVDEAKRLMVLKTNNIYTMEHIAREAGFGSVASFSRVFKEIEGTTPGKYRKKYNGVD